MKEELFITPAYEVLYDTMNRICRPAKDEEVEDLLVFLINELITRGILFRVVPNREEISYESPYKIVIELISYNEYLDGKYMKNIKYSFAVEEDFSEMVFHERNNDRTVNSITIRDKNLILEILRRKNEKLIGYCYSGKNVKDVYDKDCFAVLKLFKRILIEGFIISLPKLSANDRIPLITLIKENTEIDVLYYPGCSDNRCHYKIEYDKKRYDLFYLFFEKDYDDFKTIMEAISEGGLQYEF